MFQSTAEVRQSNFDTFKAQIDKPDVQALLLDKIRARCAWLGEDTATSNVQAAIASFLRVLKNDEGRKCFDDVPNNNGGTYKAECLRFILDADPLSIARSLIESVNTGVPVDERHLAYLYYSNGSCEYDVGYKGLVYLCQMLYADADVRAEVVFGKTEEYEADGFIWKESNGTVEYTHTRTNPFRTDDSGIIGTYAVMEYSINGRPLRRGVCIGKEDMDIIRGKAKTSKIWDEFFQEKCKGAAIRRMLKIPAVRNEEIAAIERAINLREYDMSKSVQKIQQSSVAARLLAREQEKKPAPAPEVVLEAEAQDSAQGQQAEILSKNEEEISETDKISETKPGEWDRRSVICQDKVVQKAFKNPRTAANELARLIQKIPAAPTEAESIQMRLAVLAQNRPLLTALDREGFAQEAKDLFILAQGGEHAGNGHNEVDGEIIEGTAGAVEDGEGDRNLGDQSEPQGDNAIGHSGHAERADAGGADAVPGAPGIDN